MRKNSETVISSLCKIKWKSIERKLSCAVFKAFPQYSFISTQQNDNKMSVKIADILIHIQYTAQNHVRCIS
jgi:hypothetical protein